MHLQRTLRYIYRVYVRIYNPTQRFVEPSRLIGACLRIHWSPHETALRNRCKMNGYYACMRTSAMHSSLCCILFRAHSPQDIRCSQAIVFGCLPLCVCPTRVRRHIPLSSFGILCHYLFSSVASTRHDMGSCSHSLELSRSNDGTHSAMFILFRLCEFGRGIPLPLASESDSLLRLPLNTRRQMNPLMLLVPCVVIFTLTLGPASSFGTCSVHQLRSPNPLQGPIPDSSPVLGAVIRTHGTYHGADDLVTLTDGQNCITLTNSDQTLEIRFQRDDEDGTSDS